MLIRIVDVHFVYPGGVKALDGVTMTVAPGEKVALVGENGSGKTTLARHLNGLLSPAVGCVWVGDWQTSQVSPAQMAHRVAYVFQNPDEQLFRRWVWDEVAFGPQNLGFPAGRVRSAVDEALDLMGLGDVAQINPRDLGYSGRKRVAIAGALAMQTPVLVFDEPTAGMDAKDLGQLARAIDAVNRQGKTILMISHDIDFIAESMDRLALMSQGRVVLDAPADLFFEHHDQIEKAGLLAPQITRLSRRMGQPKLALNVDQFLDG